MDFRIGKGQLGCGVQIFTSMVRCTRFGVDGPSRPLALMD